jgi:hypothetical protein
VIADEQLARRLESFQAAVGAEIASAIPGAAVLHIGDGSAVFSGVGSPLTQAIAIDQDVERVERFFFNHGSPSIIQVNPWSPRPFTDMLAARGYRVVEFENVFAMPIAQAQIPAVRIEVRETDDVATWALIAAEAFANEEMSVEFLVKVMTPLAYAKHARCYLAFVDGEAAGSAAMVALSDRRIAGFFGAGTRHRFRNRGVQTALLHRRIADAVAAGCELGLVTTEPGSASHRNVDRRGFEMLYTKLTMRLDIAHRDA